MDRYELKKCEALINKYSDPSTVHQLIDVNVVRLLDEELIEEIRCLVMVGLITKFNNKGE